MAPPVRFLSLSIVTLLALTGCQAAPIVTPTASPDGSSGGSDAPKIWSIKLGSEEQAMSADLTVSDETGHVVGLVQGRLQMAAFASTSLVVGPVADQPTVTGLDFSLAPCQHRPTIRLVPLGRSVLISLDTGPREPGGCDAMAVPYGVHIRSDQPLPMTDLVAHDQNEGTNSWGLLAPTIGDNRGIKVVH